MHFTCRGRSFLLNIHPAWASWPHTAPLRFHLICFLICINKDFKHQPPRGSAVSFPAFLMDGHLTHEPTINTTFPGWNLCLHLMPLLSSHTETHTSKVIFLCSTVGHFSGQVAEYLMSSVESQIHIVKSCVIAAYSRVIHSSFPLHTSCSLRQSGGILLAGGTDCYSHIWLALA